MHMSAPRISENFLCLWLVLNTYLADVDEYLLRCTVIESLVYLEVFFIICSFTRSADKEMICDSSTLTVLLLNGYSDMIFQIDLQLQSVFTRTQFVRKYIITHYVL